jgi:hypothetical protein
LPFAEILAIRSQHPLDLTPVRDIEPRDAAADTEAFVVDNSGENGIAAQPSLPEYIKS